MKSSYILIKTHFPKEFPKFFVLFQLQFKSYLIYFESLHENFKISMQLQN